MGAGRNIKEIFVGGALDHAGDILLPGKIISHSELTFGIPTKSLLDHGAPEITIDDERTKPLLSQTQTVIQRAKCFALRRNRACKKIDPSIFLLAKHREGGSQSPK